MKRLFVLFLLLTIVCISSGSPFRVFADEETPAPCTEQVPEAAPIMETMGDVDCAPTEPVLPSKLSSVDATDISKLISVSVPFVQNEGQINNDQVSFYTDTFAGRVFVIPSGLRYAFKVGDTSSSSVPAPTIPSKDRNNDLSVPVQKIVVVDESFVGGNSAAQIGQGVSETRVSYFKGQGAANRDGSVQSYEKVDAGDIWPGINVTYHAYGENMEKLFTIAPNSDPSQIKMQINGATIEEADDGKLLLHTETGDASLTKPIAYQEQEDGTKTNVGVSYNIISNSSYSFTVGEYDHNLPLIIDPLLALTVGGGTGLDVGGLGMAENAQGNIYTLGWTSSTNFPTSVGAYDTSYNGANDAYIVKFSNDLSNVLAATYFGGTGAESVASPTPFGFDSQGNVFATASTVSSDFPTTAGAFDNTFNGGTSDLGVVKFSSDLTTLMGGTYLGGSLLDRNHAFIVEASGSIVITGDTNSLDFPTTAGAYDRTQNGSTDFFITRLSNDLTTVLTGTYIGSSTTDHDYSNKRILEDTFGNIVMLGSTDGTDYPTTVGAYDRTAYGGPGTWDLIVSKFTNDLSTLLASTYIGGNGDDDGAGAESLAMDTSNNIYILSTSRSTDFPTTTGAYAETYLGGTSDLIIAKFSPDLTTLMASTYFGGNGPDGLSDILIDSAGEVVITATSSTKDYPITAGAFQTSRNGYYVAKLSPNLASVLAATSFGDPVTFETITSIIQEPSGNFLFSGYTFNSTTSQLFSTNSHYSYGSGGSYDLYVARVTPSLRANEIPAGALVFAGQSPASMDGQVRLSLSDYESNSVQISLEYSTDGSVWNAANLSAVSTASGTPTRVDASTFNNIPSTPGGTPVSLNWDTRGVVPDNGRAGLYMRYTVSDATGTAPVVTSSVFAITRLGGTGGGADSAVTAPAVGAPAPTPPSSSVPSTPTPVYPPRVVPNAGSMPPSDSGASSGLGSITPSGLQIPGVSALAPVIPSPFTRILSFGMRGDDVLLLQQLLNAKNYKVISPGQETNYFGALTRSAVSRFQKGSGLRVSGIADFNTTDILVQ